MYSGKGLIMEEYKKPLPVIDNESNVFWEACNKEQLVIQQCRDCSKYIFYPRIICPNCMSDQIEWKEVSGKGKIYSYTIARRPAGPSFSADVPYVVALVELEEGVRMMTNIINTPLESVRCDMEVEVIFEKVTDDIRLPKFQQVTNN
jgi:uncharacterized protein